LKKIKVLNGPNLNLLGEREPDKYGTLTLSELEKEISNSFPDIEFEFFQSNLEGELVNHLHLAKKDGFLGVVINPGGFSHTSVSILDAIKSINLPVVEVHLTNLSSREKYRQNLITGSGCISVIQGGGLNAYLSAIYLLNNLIKQTWSDNVSND